MIFPINPVLFADFTTATYIFNNVRYFNSGPWLTATGGSFSRGSTAYFTNSAGVLTQAGPNVLRIDYDPVLLTAKGALLEGTSTNNVLHSQAASNWTTFTSGAGTVSETDNAGTAPDGTTTASLLNISRALTSEFALFEPFSGLLSNGGWTGSIYVKANSAGDVGKIIMAYLNGVSTAITLITLTSSWQRISVTNANITPSQFSIGYAPGDGAGTGAVGVLVWGAQLEPLLFASSYIPTTASTASRSADNLSTNLNITSPTALTEYVSFNSAVSSANGANVDGILSANDGSANNRMDVRFQQQEAIVSNGGVNTIISLPALSSAGTYTYAAALQNNDFAASIGGAAIITASPSFPTGLSSLQIGAIDGGTSFNFFGWIIAAGIWSSRLSNTQLQTLTSGTVTFDVGTTTLTNKYGKYFSRKDYVKWLAKIVGENEEAKREYQRFIDEAEAERNLTYIQRAERDFNVAEEQLASSEAALFDNLTETNHIKFSEAKEKRDRARKERDHQYFMDIVNKEWAKYNGRQ